MAKPTDQVSFDDAQLTPPHPTEKASVQTSDVQDKLYSQPREAISSFVFDEAVVGVFEDMISRSVPGYSTLLSMLPVFGRSFLKRHTNCYDLGCSLGAASLAIHKSSNVDKLKIIAVDNSLAMIQQCRDIFEQYGDTASVDIVHADISDVDIRNASMVIMNFTLQFIEEQQRDGLIRKIANGLNAGGAFLLSEKIRFDDEAENERLIDLHHQFKKANGYSDLEISQKRSALEQVLRPESIEKHKRRILDAGFNEVVVWFQCFNFVSFIAIK